MANLMALNCNLSPPSRRTIWAMMHVYGALMGDSVAVMFVNGSDVTLTTHIKPRHVPLSRPFKARVRED